MLITKVSVQVKNKNRSNIYVDEKYYCSLDNFLVLKYNLKVGREVDENLIAEIQTESEFEKAFDLALTYITKYRKTKKQITEYLMKKGYLYPVAFKVLEKLSGYGLADDDEYARSYVEENCKNKGKLYLKMQLRARGIDEKCAEKALDNIEDETPQTLTVARKYMKNKPICRENLSKCYRYLLSKGFSYDAVNSVISELKSENDDLSQESFD